MPRSTSAQPPLEFIPPALDLNVLRLVQAAFPLWMRSCTSLAEVKATNVEELVRLYEQFQMGKIRVLLAFRHPSTNDPLTMGYLLSRLLPQVAKQQGVKLQPPYHAHFMYDRGIPLWAGTAVGWLYSKLGGTPIHRGKVDRMGLRSARDLFANGAFPLMAAPEGATNGHNEIVSPLEPGLAQLGFWCLEDLVKAGRSEQVLIVPIGIQYRYLTPPWSAIEKCLGELEAISGLPPHTPPSGSPKTDLYRRLYQLAEHLLTVMEQFYTRFYHQSLPTTGSANSSAIPGVPPGSNEEFSVRLQALMHVALQVAEQYFNVSPKGTMIDRCRRLEQAGWDYIYRDDLKNIEALSPLERGLADRVAEEANLRIWHMRLVESFVAVTGKYVLEKPTVERFAETLLLISDMIMRIKGDNPFNRPKLGKQCAHVTIGTPISVSDRWNDYKSNRRAAKQAVEDLTQTLQTALQDLIV